MPRYEKLVLTLPDEAAEKLKELAEQESKTVAAFVTEVVDEWLEKRRRDVRLGRAKYPETTPLVRTGTDKAR